MCGDVDKHIVKAHHALEKIHNSFGINAKAVGAEKTLCSTDHIDPHQHVRGGYKSEQTLF